MSRRPWRAAVDEHAPAPVALVLRRLAADLIRCVFPNARRWRSLPDAEAGPVHLAPLASLGPGWGDAAVAAMAALEGNDPAAAGEAAARLSELAEGARLPLLAALFAEAAALASWEDPERALRVSTLARDRADHRAAEWWGERAAQRALALETWETAARSFARVADAAERRGAFGKAVAYRQKEVAATRRSGARELHARATHSLFASFLHAGKPEEAARAFIHAWELYGQGHPRLWGLMHDAAFYPLSQGEAQGIIPLLVASMEEAEGPGVQMVVAANLARAAAMAGETTLSVDSTRTALEAMDADGWGGDAGWVLTQLARAAADRGERETARDWAGRALVLGEERGEQATTGAARSILLSLANALERQRDRSAPDEAGQDRE